jgi:hypothetical protein
MKNVSPRKLSLSKTTLKRLCPDDLGKIAGGPDTTADCSGRRCSDTCGSAYCGGGSLFSGGLFGCNCLPPAL